MQTNLSLFSFVISFKLRKILKRKKKERKSKKKKIFPLLEH